MDGGIIILIKSKKLHYKPEALLLPLHLYPYLWGGREIKIFNNQI